MTRPAHPTAPASAQPYRIGQPRYGGNFSLLAEPPGPTVAQSQPFVLPHELVVPDLQAPAHAFCAPHVLEASVERVRPGCVHFGHCGGCHYQHGSYPAQLAWKKTIVDDLFADAGLTGLPPVRVLAGEPWGYRNRIRLRLAMLNGTLRAGYRERGTSSFLPVHMCPIAAPLLWRAVEAVLTAAAADPAAARWLASCAELELFTNASESALQLTFFVADPALARQEPQTFPTLCERLKLALPALTGAGALADPELSRRVRRAWAGQTWGSPGLTYSVSGREHWVSRGSFFQANRFLIEPLVDLVLAPLPAHSRLAWDLFAGVGLFTQPLEQQSDRVVAVEGADSAAKDLTQGLARTTRLAGRPADALTAVACSTLDFLTAHQFDRERPDVVVLDPPRAGLGPEAAAILARIGPALVVYVSCDPTTLARDLAVLLAAGYQATSATVIDLFPQTFHIETVLHLTRT